MGGKLTKLIFSLLSLLITHSKVIKKNIKILQYIIAVYDSKNKHNFSILSIL